MQNFVDIFFSKEVTLRECFSNNAIALVNREASEIKIRLNRNIKRGVDEL